MRHLPFTMLIAALMLPLLAFSQQRFHRRLPPGNYSAVCPLGNDRYALVSDKSAEDGFFVVHIAIDSLRRRITSLANEGFRSSGLPNRDMEAVCYRPSSQTLFIAGEHDNEVYEYTLDGQRTGRRLQMPEALRHASRHYGIEALCYDSLRQRFFLTTERPLPGDSLLRIQTFDDSLQPAECYLYQPDAPRSSKYFHGVSELCTLDDGRLLVLERQLRVPRLKIGARTLIRIYEVSLPPVDSLHHSPFTTHPSSDSLSLEEAAEPSAPLTILPKRLLLEFTTRLNLTSRKFANYEGFCQPAPGLLLLVADSQNRYKGILRDWFRVVSISD